MTQPTAPPLEAVLIDWWGTLEADTLTHEDVLEGTRRGLVAIGWTDVNLEQLQQRFVEYRREFPRHVVDEFVIADVMLECFRRHGINVSPDEVENYMQVSQDYWRGTHRFFPGAHSFLKELRALNLKTALVSNFTTPGRFVWPILHEQGVGDAFDAVVMSSDVGKRKPHPAVFTAALDALDVGPSAAVFIGDLLREDVAGAARVGLRTIQAAWVHDDRESAEAAPTVRAESFEAALDFIRALVQ